MKPLVAVSANSCWALTNYRLGLLKALQLRGFAVAALVPDEDRTGKLGAAGVRLVRIPLKPHGKSPFEDFNLFLRYLVLLRRLKPRAYLGFTIKPNIYGALAARLLGIPTIANITGLGKMFAGRGMLRSLAAQLYRMALSGSARVMFQNRESLETFEELGIVDAKRSILLPGSGIDLRLFAPAPRERRSAPFTFLLSGRLLWEKGIGEYYCAGRRLRQMRDDVRLLLLGPFEPESNSSAIPKQMVDQWQAEGVIEYLGFTDDVRPYLQSADCIVLPSYYPEGVPRALIEAAAMAKPIITTDTPGCRETIEEHATGYFCEIRSAESLFETMLLMLDKSSEEREHMQKKARQRAEALFDEKKVIDTYLHEIDALVAQRDVART